MIIINTVYICDVYYIWCITWNSKRRTAMYLYLAILDSDRFCMIDIWKKGEAKEDSEERSLKDLSIDFWEYKITGAQEDSVKLSIWRFPNLHSDYFYGWI